jgi:hypothetical protein
MKQNILNLLNAIAAIGKGRHSAAFLAMLPHLIFAILTALSPPSGIAIILWIMLVAAFLLAWRQGWPLWSGSWAGYWLLYSLILISLTGLFRWLPVLGLDLLLLLLLLAVAVPIFQRRPLYGLLGSGPLLILMPRFFVFELVAGGEWIWSGVWLLLALTSGVIIWLGSIRTGVLLMLGFHLLTGVAFALGRAYLPFHFDQMGPRQVAEWQTLVNDFVPLTLALVAILLALLLLQPLNCLAAQHGRRGRRYYVLLLLGMALTLGGGLALRTQPRLPVPTALSVTAASVAIAAGLIVSASAALLLTRGTWRDGLDRLYALLLPLLAVFTPLVVFAQAPPFTPDGRYSDHSQVVILLSYGGVILWLLAALWVISSNGRRGQTLAFPRQPFTALLLLLAIGILPACGGVVPGAAAVPAEVTFETPETEIVGGLRLEPPEQSWDGYGEAVDVYGDVLVVGASEWNPCGHGSAYVYRASGGGWSLEAQLTAGDRDDFVRQARRFEGQRFGTSVAAGEGIIAVGAPGNVYLAGEAFPGAVYLYDYDGHAWMEMARLTPDSSASGAAPAWLAPSVCGRLRPALFGALVALDGDKLAVGGDAGGLVYIYQRGALGWREQARIAIPSAPGKELYMAFMALSGDTLALSAFYVPPQSEQHPALGGILSGNVIVYVFERGGENWQESFRFAPEGEADILFLREVNMGASVALSGDSGQANLLAVGLPGFPDWSGVEEHALIFGAVPRDSPEPIPTFPTSQRQSGAVYLFERSAGGWNQKATLRPAGWQSPPGPSQSFPPFPSYLDGGENEAEADAFFASWVFPGHIYSEAPEITFFGATVDLHGDRLAVTAGFANATYVFERRDENWLYRFSVKPVQEKREVWEDSAQVVAIDGHTLLLGTPSEFGNSAYVFSLSPGDER